MNCSTMRREARKTFQRLRDLRADGGLDQIEARRLPGTPRHGDFQVAFTAVVHRQRHRQTENGAVLARLGLAAELVMGPTG